MIRSHVLSCIVITEYLQGLVMEFGEWMRIKDGLKKAEDEAKRREKKILEQKALHEMSKSLVKNWENTIEVLVTSPDHQVFINNFHIGSKVEKVRSQEDQRRKGRSKFTKS